MTDQFSMPQPWPADVQRLFDLGGHDAMRVVGGAVRDTLLSRDLSHIDYDFATTHAPKQVMALLEKAGITVKPTGIDHGTVTAILNGKPYEITSLRRDVEADGRRAVVRFTTDWAEDAQRRDFTINALYADANGMIHDPTGQGIADIQSKTLRFIGDADTRIREDYLRILRLYRFLSTVPGIKADPAAIVSCEALADGLDHLSGERITAEITKLLRGENAAEALRIMSLVAVRLGVQDAASGLFQVLAGWRHIISVSDAVLFVLALGAVTPGWMVVSNAVKKERERLIALQDDQISWQEAAFRYGLPVAISLYVVRCVIAQKPVPAAGEWAAITGYHVPLCPITAEDLQKEGFFHAELGRELKNRQEIWICSTFRK